MKAQEKKLIVDLYKHYKSVPELSDDEIDVIYNKYGKIRDILKNLIQEFEPDAIITEEYLDEKLRAYGISEVDDLNIEQDEILISNDEVPKKGKNKLLLISLIIIVATGISVFVLFNENKEVRIGDQIWMSKNLNVDKFRNGDLIPEAKTAEDWKKAGENKQPAWSYYNNDPANGAKYGKLYNWYAVNDSRGLAPEGWKIPSDEDWSRLTDFLGGERVAGTKMKSTDFWADYDGESGNGTNESGFQGLPGGYRSSFGSFNAIGKYGVWWSSSENATSNAWSRDLNYYNGNVNRNDDDKAIGFSVRCLRD
jgi:uncharacterized protein (TIGR02145 family)